MNTKHVVYMASALSRYADTMGQMMSALARHGVEVKILDTGNIWLRDWMPIQVGDHFVKFAYKGYGGDAVLSQAGGSYAKWPWLNVPDSTWRVVGKNIRKCPIVLDGGNIIWSPKRDRVICTDIMFRHNPAYSHTDLISLLEETLQAQVILMPVEPEDTLGHTDGLCHFVDDNAVLLNDYRAYTNDSDWLKHQAKAEHCLLRAGLSIVPMVWDYESRPKMRERDFRRKFPMADDFNPGWGYLVNFLKVKDVILLPKMGIEKPTVADVRAKEILTQNFPGHEVVHIDCADLSMEGGLTSCTTMEYCL